MAVYKKTYRPYDGALTSPWQRLLVIPRYALADLQRSKFLNIFFICTLIYPLVCALLIYLQHNSSALSLLNAQAASRLISINVVFFLSLLGWQSMLALFLASFIGPGQVSPDLANNALALFLMKLLHCHVRFGCVHFNFCDCGCHLEHDGMRIVALA